MSDIQRIVMVAYTSYPSDPRVRREAEALASLPDKKVTVLTNKASDVPRTYILQGVEVQELNYRKYQGNSNVKYFLSYLTFTLLAFLQCTKLVLQNSVDIVHVHNMPNFLIFSAIVPCIAGKKIILDIHDTMVETYAAKFSGKGYGLIPRILRAEERLCCLIADKIISVNHVQRKSLVKRNIPESKIVIVLNVPDPKFFSYRTKTGNPRIPSGDFKMVYHGTVTDRLGIDLAIRAVARLKPEIPGIKFYVIGAGEDWEKYISLSKELGIQDQVVFRGSVPLEGLASILEEMDLGIIPNRRSEASELMLPVKMMEYVALRIPVVAPRLTAIKYYFSDDMVYFFDPNDIDSLASAIRSAYSSEADRNKKSEKAMEFIKQYGWEIHKKDFLALYHTGP